MIYRALGIYLLYISQVSRNFLFCIYRNRYRSFFIIYRHRAERRFGSFARRACVRREASVILLRIYAARRGGLCFSYKVVQLVERYHSVAVLIRREFFIRRLVSVYAHRIRNVSREYTSFTFLKRRHLRAAGAKHFEFAVRQSCRARFNRFKFRAKVLRKAVARIVGSASSYRSPPELHASIIRTTFPFISAKHSAS